MKISAKYTEVLLYVSLKTQGSVCGKWAAIHCSRWRSSSTYTGDIYEWRKAERQEIDTRIDKANAVLRELYRSVDKTGTFKHRKAVRF